MFLKHDRVKCQDRKILREKDQGERELLSMSSKRTERQTERKELNRLRSKEIDRGLFRMQICIYSRDKHEHVAKNITYVDSGRRLPLTQLSVELTQKLNREVKSITQLKSIEMLSMKCCSDHIGNQICKKGNWIDNSAEQAVSVSKMLGKAELMQIRWGKKPVA